jgi:hypothetical protein
LVKQKKKKKKKNKKKKHSTTSFTEPGLSLFSIRHKTVPSFKHILKTSSEALSGKLKSGRVLFNHSNNIARCLAAKKKSKGKN